jgi:hypothetical protein
MLKFILVLVFVLFGAGCFKFSAQNLTISSSGQTSNPGTNWSITGNTLTVTGTANIRASVIVNALANGNLTIVGNSTNFAVALSEAISSTTAGSSLTIGSMTNTGAITFSADISLAGGINVMGGDVRLNGNITSTATGDMFFQGLGDAWSIRLATGKTIEKTAGTGLLTMQGNGRINNSTSAGSILASGSAMLNVVIINELNSGTAGLYNISTGNITTNGGHLWIGAGAKTRVWNGFSVGSTGVPGNTNYNGIDVTGNISTSGGDILLWAFVGSNARSAGYGDITALSTNRTISSGSGDITLMTRYNDFVNGTPDINISTTGTLTLAPASGANFDVALAFSGSTTSGTFTGTGGMNGLIIQNFTSVNELVIGTYNGTGISGDTPYTSANTADITITQATSVAGPITIYGGYVNINGNLTSSANGDIFIKGVASTNPSILLQSGKTITKSGGTGTLTFQGHGRVQNSGTITTSGTGVLNLVLWSDFDNSNNDGGVSHFGTISTNGGHVWMGGSSSNGGSYTWNGLTVGDGPSIGTTGFNNNGLDLFGNITTAGGDFLAWAGNGASSSNFQGIANDGSGDVVNVGTGDIILITDAVSGTSGDAVYFRQNGGSFTLVPNGGDFGATFNWNPGIESVFGGTNNGYNLGTGNFNWLAIENPSTLTSFTIGRYDGLLSGSASVVMTNSSNITFSTATTFGGSVRLEGGTITLNSNLTATNNGDISIFGNALSFASGKTITSSGQLIVAPQTASNTIGLGGASGTLSLPASYFSTNFADGFSNIQIGSNIQTGNISSNAFTLLDNMKILTSGSLTLGGKPVLGMNNLTLGSDIVTVNVGSPANYFQTTGSGKVVREISSGTSRLLPVGNLYYNPLTVSNNTGSADFFSARVLDSVCLNGLTGPVITSPHVKVTWDIDKVNLNTGSGIDFEFGWDATQEIGSINGYKVNHPDGTSWSFAAGTSNTPVGTAYKTLTHSGYTGTFSPFAISESSFPLPVTLINLSASCASSKVELSWQTASEWHSDYFQVEYSLDGTEWLALEKVPAAGNSTSLQQYTYSDLTPSRLMRYYRLKQVDLNGQYEIYGPIASECIVDGMDFTIYPNPSSTSATIELLNTKKETAEIKLLDISGKEFWSQELELVNGTTSMVLSTENLAPGIYIIVLSSKDGILTNKLVVE